MDTLDLTESQNARNLAGNFETVTFAGAELECVYDEQEQRVWVSLRRACEALGIAYNAQRTKLEDTHWATVSIIDTVAEDGKNRGLSCIDLDTLGMWLATIQVNRVAPEARDTVMRYQKECVKVLREHFFGSASPAVNFQGKNWCWTLTWRRQSIRVLMWEDSQETWWVGNDLLAAMGFKTDGPLHRVKHYLSPVPDSAGNVHKMRVLDEEAVLRILVTSKKRSMAKQFVSWFNATTRDLREQLAELTRKPEPPAQPSPEVDDALQAKILAGVAHHVMQSMAQRSPLEWEEALKSALLTAPGASTNARCVLARLVPCLGDEQAVKELMTEALREVGASSAANARQLTTADDISVERFIDRFVPDADRVEDHVRRWWSLRLRRALLKRPDLSEIAVNTELKRLFGRPRAKWSKAQFTLACRHLQRNYALEL